MKRNRVLIICPKFYPAKDGLSGHTTKLCSSLAKEAEVHLMTNKKPYEHDFPFRIYPFDKKWKFSDLKKFTSPILANSFDHILIQYVPSLYGKRGGINFSVILFFIYLRLFSKSKISIIFHELYFPFSFYWKHIILNLSHRIMLLGAMLSCHFAFFSTIRFLKESKNFNLLGANTCHLPVGDNLFVPHNREASDIKIDQTQLNFVIFGSPHPSKNIPLVFKCLNNLDIAFNLHLIGPTFNEVEEEAPLSNKLLERTIFYPKLEDESVIDIFQKSDILLAYFVDGMTTRRSSAIGALAHGMSLISTKSHHTENIFNGVDGIKLFSTKPDIFEKAFAQIDFKQMKNQKSSADTTSFYNKFFSWGIIQKSILSKWED